MPRFERRLQPLLEVRSRERDEKRRIFVRRRSELDAELVRCERLTYALQMRTAALWTSGRSLALDLRQYDDHLSFLERSIAARSRFAEGLRSERDRAGVELVAASRACRVLEMLEERRRRAFAWNEARLEELELDEANARAANRRLT
jgi:flagellar export protein FliJ